MSVIQNSTQGQVLPAEYVTRLLAKNEVLNELLLVVAEELLLSHSPDEVIEAVITRSQELRAEVLKDFEDLRLALIPRP